MEGRAAGVSLRAQAGRSGEKALPSATPRSRASAWATHSGARSAGSSEANSRSAAALSLLTRQKAPLHALVGRSAAAARIVSDQNPGDLGGVLAVATAVAAQVDYDNGGSAQLVPTIAHNIHDLRRIVVQCGKSDPLAAGEGRHAHIRSRWLEGVTNEAFEDPQRHWTPVEPLFHGLAIKRVEAARNGSANEWVLVVQQQRESAAGDGRLDIRMRIESAGSDAGECLGVDAVAGEQPGTPQVRLAAHAFLSTDNPLAGAPRHHDACPNAAALRQKRLRPDVAVTEVVGEAIEQRGMAAIVLHRRQSLGGIGARGRQQPLEIPVAKFARCAGMIAFDELERRFDILLRELVPGALGRALRLGRERSR